MRILLDSHVVILLINEPEKLADDVIEIIVDGKNEIFCSLASIWEIAIKLSIGRIEVDLEILLETLKNNNILLLHIDEKHILKTKSLPLLHKDPFDRMIVAQTIVENLCLFTRDKVLREYSKKLIKLV